LVVGLGFIIMFGLILTELTGTNNSVPPPSLANDDSRLAYAPVEQVSPAVSNNVGLVPAAGRPGATELSPATSLSAQASPLLPTKPLLAPPPPLVPEVVAEVKAPTPVVAERPKPPVVEELQPVEPVVAKVEIAPEPAAEPAANVQKHTVAAKDTLIKIARKYYGPENERDYKRILEANKKTLSSETALKVGQELIIPALPQAKPEENKALAKSTAATGVKQVDIDQLQKELAGSKASDKSLAKNDAKAVAGDKVPAPKGGTLIKADETDLATLIDSLDSSSSGKKGNEKVVASAAKAGGKPDELGVKSADKSGKTKTYVVREGDTLHKIARRVLKNDSKSSVGKIFSANKDKLAHPEKLQVGMKLEIPT